MEIDEKKDMLLYFLATLYEIKAGQECPNPVLDRKIKITEKRLEIFGVTDITSIR